MKIMWTEKICLRFLFCYFCAMQCEREMSLHIDLRIVTVIYIYDEKICLFDGMAVFGQLRSGQLYRLPVR